MTPHPEHETARSSRWALSGLHLPAQHDLQTQSMQALSAQVQYSNDSERGLCACVLRPAAASGDPALHAKLFALLCAEDFHVPQHESIWRFAAALQCAGVEPSALAIADAALQQGAHVGGAAYLAGLMEDPLCRVASAEALVAAAQRVKSLALLRRLQTSLQHALVMCQRQDFTRVVSFIEDDVANLRRSAHTSRGHARPIGAYMDTVITRIETMTGGEPSSDGIRTGFVHLDALITELLPETLNVLAARPAMGKTAFALNIARSLACQRGLPVLVFSLEMTGAALAQRTLATEGRISLHRLKRADLHQEEWARLVESVEAMRNAPIFIDESPGLTLSSIRSRAREFKQHHPAGLIVLDYLQIVAMDRQQRDKFAHVADVSRGLKELARELQLPVLALSQLSRDLEKRTNKRPMLSDLRESGQIEQDAEVIIFLYRDEVYNPDTHLKGVTEVIVGKNRDGPTGTVRMRFDGEHMSFSELGLVDP